MRIKYSPLILEEAFNISLEYGIPKASKKTGVGFEALRKYVHKRRREKNIISRRTKRIFVSKPPMFLVTHKIACIHLARKMFDAGYYSTITKSLYHACKKIGIGIDPVNLLKDWKSDRIRPSYWEAQHPDTLAELSGKSIHIANPHGQSLAEQCKALKSLWPPPRMRSRREYISPTSPRSV